MRLFVFFFTLVFALPGFAQQSRKYNPDLSFIRVDSIQIIRDQWGVPHIYAPTDAEVSYGLAWVQCEDDFETLQDFMLIIKGYSGRKSGIEGAKLDYAVGMLRSNDLVKAEYDKQVPPEMQKYLRAFAAGVNRWAELHPEEVLFKKAFPVTEYDLAAGFNLGLSMMSGVQDAFTKILENKLPPPSQNPPKGSNAMAIHSSKTEDGKAYIAINSHQPLSGIMSWYEAHLVSGEGMNILGGAFPGACIIGHGVNEHLAWAHTVSFPDLKDFYKLEMHPKKKNYYRFDGQWKKLESKRIPLTVRFPKSKIQLTIGKKGFWSVYGPTLKTDHGVYSFTLPTFGQLKAPEQWFNMGKAKSYAEFRKAMEIQHVPCFNIVYADRYDTIMYISNVTVPVRNPAYDWTKTLPGDTSATLWSQGFQPVDKLPQVVNPASGFVYNANNSPFLCTHPNDNPDPKKYDITMGTQTLHSNRSKRFEELLVQATQNGKIDWNTFNEIKYDRQYPDTFQFPVSVDHVFYADPEKYPEIKEELKRIQRWNKRGDTDNVEASMFLMTLHFVMEDYGGFQFNLTYRPLVEETLIVNSVIKAREFLLKHYGTLDVKLGQLQRHRRDGEDWALPGLPDMIVAMYSSPREDGTMAPRAGESYIMMVKMGKNGPEIESVNAFGACSRTGDTYACDQMEMFTKHQLKPMSLDWKEVKKTAVRIYNPQ
ncbi:MAG: penicillin acylase family protein [Flavobacteriales bacterium]|nr:penicillin acylase family protein [Flavobacteriales bacterium]